MDIPYEEWDKLAQNPFLAFYQRWPWLAQNTPLLNLWNPTIDTVVDFLVLFLLPSFSILFLDVFILSFSAFNAPDKLKLSDWCVCVMAMSVSVPLVQLTLYALWGHHSIWTNSIVSIYII